MCTATGGSQLLHSGFQIRQIPSRRINCRFRLHRRQDGLKGGDTPSAILLICNVLGHKGLEERVGSFVKLGFERRCDWGLRCSFRVGGLRIGSPVGCGTGRRCMAELSVEDVGDCLELGEIALERGEIGAVRSDTTLKLHHELATLLL